MGPVTRGCQAQVLWTVCDQGYHLTLSSGAVDSLQAGLPSNT